MTIRSKSMMGVALAAALVMTVSACATDAEPGAEEPTESLAGNLEGAGASFPDPVFQEYAFAYSGDVQPGVQINYQSIGSGGGIEQFLLETVDFGSSEKFLDDETLAEASEIRGCDAIQFPVLFGAVTIAFGDDQFDGLVLEAETIAAIFQREITNYNDPAIAALNPDFDLPDLEIIPVHRSDGSGTTSVFTVYLDDAADNWELGNGTEAQWPSGTIGGKGNEGVTAGIQQNDGGLGYINQAYALINDLPTAAVVNADGNAVEATLEATTEALDVLEIPESFQYNILGIGGGGYPIAGSNWIFAWECGYDENQEALLKSYWTWATQSDEANALATDLGYAPLGEGLKPKVQAAIDRINSKN
ncbi:phosphate ABC transporter substrate-binding protein (PhoT family) [Rhodoglobus vestalii]|uniref:Phosphate-binding protein n=1 Tax=Rhodoglobus vestalii TaxID=193384 RepID=A0A8H2K7K1_9MICO|nr:phosphate ABC transporter substrate-binding protein PstS [Rhodoglobus vestalii]TQO20630.1 phosphate ABC transporter substrate-binding protein (PhoT family) [Rhodoglobus vestalii]